MLESLVPAVGPAVNHVRSRWRRLGSARRHGARFAVDGVAADGSDATDDRIRVITALRRLPLVQREAIALPYLADLSLAEIAGRTDVPVGTVKARLSRGREALRGLLGSDYSLEGAHDA